MEATSQDSTLRWAMRIVGLLLGVTCALLLTRDVVRTDEAAAFLIIGSALGVITFVSSWAHSRHTPAPETVRS